MMPLLYLRSYGRSAVLGYVMVVSRLAVIVALVSAIALGPTVCFGAGSARPCLPDMPVPPETVGPVSLPFDVPVWPTIVKTEFNILPWVSLGKASICIPGTCKAIEVPAPCFSLKPIPVWFPWLRPLDVECTTPTCIGP